MKLNSLRKLIREEVEQALDEAEKKPAGPKSFDDFRKKFAAALKKAGAPEELVDELDDVSYTGGDVVGACFSAWENIEQEMKDEAFVWPTDAEFYVHDCVLDMVDAFSNPMNYAPGERRKAIDANELAHAVVDAISPATPTSPTGKKDREVRDMSMLVSDILDAAVKAGAIYGVDWDRGKTSIPYNVERSDYLEIIDRIATGAAGLKSVGAEDDVGTYSDDLTGLTVTFGDGVATIK